MSNRSEDEWSLVSEDEETLSDTSFDEVEAEPEVQVQSDPSLTVAIQVALVDCSDEATAATEDASDVVSLLAETSAPERSIAGYSREVRVSLLSPAHQEWLVGAPPIYSAPPSTSSAKRNIKVAFAGCDARPKSFPERLRALAAVMRPLSEEVSPPTFTEVTPFKQDQCTQVNLDAPTTNGGGTRAVLLRSALDRTMTMATQLRIKSQNNERLSFRIAELESVVVQTEKKAQRDAMHMRKSERSLALAKQQAKLSVDYQENLKAIAETLRRENADLAAQSRVFRGEGESLAMRSVEELEELEKLLTRGMDSVRAALRAKYRAAMEKRREEDLCVVCFEKPVAVVLLPCRHQALCASCAVRVTSCPIDRKDIQDKVLTFGLSAYTGEN
jgi:aryl carrier-like protein